MAATVAWARGYGKTGPAKEVSRLGHEFSQAEANTYRTFALVCIRKDGSGYVEIKRDQEVIHKFGWEKEN